MSVKILQREGLVVPISGKICDNCKADYESNYATKPGEKIVIIMPKAQLPVTKPALAIPSPFVATSPVPPQPTSVLDQTATIPSHPNLMKKSVLTRDWYVCLCSKFQFTLGGSTSCQIYFLLNSLAPSLQPRAISIFLFYTP